MSYTLYTTYTTLYSKYNNMLDMYSIMLDLQRYYIIIVNEDSGIIGCDVNWANGKTKAPE